MFNEEIRVSPWEKIDQGYRELEVSTGSTQYTSKWSYRIPLHKNESDGIYYCFVLINTTITAPVFWYVHLF